MCKNKAHRKKKIYGSPFSHNALKLNYPVKAAAKKKRKKKATFEFGK